MRRKDVNMLSGSIFKGLLVVAIPVMVMNVLQSLFNIIDMAILKAYDTGGGSAVGAVGVCGTLISLITGLVIGVSTGANAIVARYIGRKDQESVERSIGSSMAFSVVSGIALAIIGVFGAELFLRLVNCPDKLLKDAVLYFRLYFAGVPLAMVYNFCASILRASGDSRRPMMFLTIGGVVKVALTFLFIAQFRMGVKGVAFATILSWAVTAVLGMLALLRNEGILKICARNIRFYKREIKQILHIGIPAGLQQALYSIANVIITSTVNTFGPEATTGISIANNYDGILYQVSMAASFAVLPYVSQNVGAGNVKRAIKAIWTGTLITVCMGASVGGLSAIFSGELASLLSSDPVVIGYAQQKMIIISSTYFICGINGIVGAALQGMGKPMIVTIATLIWMCAFRFVWVYLIFPLMPNLTFLYLVWPIGWIMSIAMLMCVLLPTVKKLQRDAAAHALQANA